MEQMFTDEWPKTRAQLAVYLGLSRQTLTNYASLGKGPAYKRVGDAHNAMTLYFEDDVDAWLNERAA